MEVKLFEVRDRCTRIPMMAVLVNPTSEKDINIMAYVGYDPAFNARKVVMACGLEDENPVLTIDPNYWDFNGFGRTRAVAHNHIIDHWDELKSGAVVDVRFILGETDAPAESELNSPQINLKDYYPNSDG